MQSQGVQQVQKQAQTHVFTPQLGQSLEILQVSALELRDVILEELQSNPVLEELSMDESILDKNEEGLEEFDFGEEQKMVQKLDEDWTSGQEGERYSGEREQRRQYFLDSVTTEKSLQEYIIEQAKLFGSRDEELRAMEFLVGSLDDKGFLLMSISELSKFSGLAESTLGSALEVLKSLDPVGMGSKDVQECLLVQLNAKGQGASMAAKIISDHYPLLLRRRIPELAKKMELTVEEVQRILEEIAMLDPAPGRRFQEDHNRIVVADARVEKIGGNWVVSLNNEYIPKLRLSKIYKDLIAKGQLTATEKEYIQDKMRSGKFILNAIEQRQKSLERMTNAIVHFQRDFFDNGISYLHPLTMNEMAEYLNLHETTVSRTIANKFLETPNGLFPYKYFFTSGYNIDEKGGGVSNTSIKEEILRIVQSEVPGRPYSDQKIAEILAERNITIARRTVAKYREEVGILSTSLRRKY